MQCGQKSDYNSTVGNIEARPPATYIVNVATRHSMTNTCLFLFFLDLQGRRLLVQLINGSLQLVCHLFALLLQLHYDTVTKLGVTPCTRKREEREGEETEGREGGRERGRGEGGRGREGERAKVR
jgi:hypothetical protein